MNLLAWMLALTSFFLMLSQAVDFQRAIVCRQNAWLKSTELKTRQLLHQPMEKEIAVDAGCRLFVKRDGDSISWMQLPERRSHRFVLNLRGKI